MPLGSMQAIDAIADKKKIGFCYVLSCLLQIIVVRQVLYLKLWN